MSEHYAGRVQAMAAVVREVILSLVHALLVLAFCSVLLQQLDTSK
jgi:hypothetical protein